MAKSSVLLALWEARVGEAVHASTRQAVPVGGLRPGQRLSVGRRREVVLRLLRGKSADDLSRELGAALCRLEG